MGLFLWLSALSLLVLLLLRIIKIRSNSSLPPSPPKLPLIGNLHQLGSLPHRSLRALSSKHGHLMLLHLGQVPVLVVSSPEIAREVLRTKDPIFAGRPPSKIVRLLFRANLDIAFAPYGEHWRQARKLCMTHLFSSKMLQSFRSLKEEEVGSMICKISKISKKAVNMSKVLNMFSTGIISRAVTGKLHREGHRGEILGRMVEENSVILGGFHPADFFPAIGRLDLFEVDARAKRSAERWDKVFDEVIMDVQTSNQMQSDETHTSASFVEVLLSLERDDGFDFPFTRGNLKALLLNMYGAGIDTTYIVLEWSMAELVRNPDSMKKLQGEVRAVARGKDSIKEEDVREMSYLKAVIKEVMRLHPPAPLLLPRESTQNCEIAGYQIPKGTRVIVNAWAIGRDRKFWEEPEIFKPERFIDSSVDYKGSDFQFIPFGAGRRICPGMNFAVQTIELALANLVYRFDWELPGDMRSEELDMSEFPGLATRRKLQLELVAKHFSLMNNGVN